MIISFPHMGNMHVVLRSLFAGFGCEVMTPPPISKKTLELGAKYSPETVCLPFKMTLGNFIEVLDQGADTIVTCGGVGPCRLGYYSEIQKGILNRLGYKFNLIAVEPDLIDALKKLRLVSSGKSWLEIYHSFKIAGAKMSAIDNVERQLNFIRCREAFRGSAEKIARRAIDSIDEAQDIGRIREIADTAIGELKEVKQINNIEPLKIGLVGEIYVMLEPYINQELERRMGEMGVEVHKTMYLSDYVRAHLLKKKEYISLHEVLAALARPYLGHYVGGHGLKSIAQTIHMGQQGYDGMIQAYPFTCMPEVIAKNILPQVSKDLDIPVLTLSYDEQSGEAGVLTRLEAFIDLLKYRRQRKAAQLK
ncbi:acyl-CoA dehydratase activase-related protein [Dendrosporobacter sp. 1207_IL3150]|uniref:acyl-CoA dehydratase activase-related protein n=1 Tax=Dendrosporobacter sp. 1207_IL3150 TaxID=3084054 RepID=UPI002FD89D22